MDDTFDKIDSLFSHIRINGYYAAYLNKHIDSVTTDTNYPLMMRVQHGLEDIVDLNFMKDHHE